MRLVYSEYVDVYVDVLGNTMEQNNGLNKTNICGMVMDSNVLTRCQYQWVKHE